MVGGQDQVRRKGDAAGRHAPAALTSRVEAAAFSAAAAMEFESSTSILDILFSLVLQRKVNKNVWRKMRLSANPH